MFAIGLSRCQLLVDLEASVLCSLDKVMANGHFMLNVQHVYGMRMLSTYYYWRQSKTIVVHCLKGERLLASDDTNWDVHARIELYFFYFPRVSL